MDPLGSSYTFEQFQGLLSNKIQRRHAERLLDLVERRALTQDETYFNADNAAILEPLSDKSSPPSDFLKEVFNSIREMPLGGPWRTKDKWMMQKFDRLLIGLETVCKSIQGWINQIQDDLAALDALPMAKDHWVEKLNQIKKSYENDTNDMARERFEALSLIQAMEKRCAVLKKTTTAKSYLLFYKAHDTSLEYVSGNREAYDVSSDLIVQKKKVLEEQLQKMNQANQSYKDKVSELAAKFDLTVSFVEPVPTQLTQKNSPISNTFMYMEPSEQRSIFNIFIQLIKKKQRLEQKYLPSLDPMPSLQKDRIGFSLHIVNDWTPCFNYLTKKGTTEFLSSMLNDEIDNLKNRFQKRDVDLGIQSHQIEAFMKLYNSMVGKINDYLQVIATKNHVSEKSYQLFACCHDTEARTLQSNVDAFVADKKSFEAKKEELKKKIGELNSSIADYIMKLQLEEFSKKEDAFTATAEGIKKTFNGYVETLHDAFQAYSTQHDDPDPLGQQYITQTKNIEPLAKFYLELIKTIDKRVEDIKMGRLQVPIFALRLDQNGLLLKDSISKEISPDLFMTMRNRLVDKFKELNSTLVSFDTLLKQYQAMYKTPQNSWGEWFYQMNYNVWYAPPSSQPWGEYLWSWVPGTNSSNSN